MGYTKWNGEIFSLISIFLSTILVDAAPLDGLGRDDDASQIYTIVDLAQPMKRSLAYGRNSYRPGKRSPQEIDYDMDDNLLLDPTAKKSLALGRITFRPGKRSVYSDLDAYDFPKVREDQMGKRSLTLGRGHYRPGKRSLAIGRPGFRPSKRAPLDLEIDTLPMKKNIAAVSSSYLPENLESFTPNETYENLGRLIDDMANRHKYVVVQQLRPTPLAHPSDTS